MSTNVHQSNLRKTIPENQQHAKAHSHLFISGLDPKSVNVETIVVKNVLYCETIFKFVLKKKQNSLEAVSFLVEYCMYYWRSMKKLACSRPLETIIDQFDLRGKNISSMACK